MQLITSSGVHNLGNARGGNKEVNFWLQLYQWGDTTDVRGNREAKRFETHAILAAECIAKHCMQIGMPCLAWNFPTRKLTHP